MVFGPFERDEVRGGRAHADFIVATMLVHRVFTGIGTNLLGRHLRGFSRSAASMAHFSLVTPH
jgi:hypothetical protein